MSNEQYRNREIDQMFKDMGDKLDLILQHIAKTDNRVDKLEERSNSFENWKWFLSGGLLIMSMFVIPLVVFVWSQNTSESIQKSVDSAFEKVKLESK